ncbi:hypothetical protein EEA47_02785 [Vibrio alginolyticus]|nr:hypothetical protein EEA47_02785 [Vibrio alginolyticus]
MITKSTKIAFNKAFKSDSQRLAVSLRSSIAKRCSHLNAALGIQDEIKYYSEICMFRLQEGV